MLKWSPSCNSSHKFSFIFWFLSYVATEDKMGTWSKLQRNGAQAHLTLKPEISSSSNSLAGNETSWADCHIDSFTLVCSKHRVHWCQQHVLEHENQRNSTCKPITGPALQDRCIHACFHYSQSSPGCLSHRMMIELQLQSILQACMSLV